MSDWEIFIGKKFKRDFKKISYQLQKKVEQILFELQSMEHPEEQGIYKPSMRAYSYRINKSDRIVYTVDRVNKILYFHSVGNHKMAYGKD